MGHAARVAEVHELAWKTSAALAGCYRGPSVDVAAYALRDTLTVVLYRICTAFGSELVEVRPAGTLPGPCLPAAAVLQVHQPACGSAASLTRTAPLLPTSCASHPTPPCLLPFGPTFCRFWPTAKHHQHTAPLLRQQPCCSASYRARHEAATLQGMRGHPSEGAAPAPVTMCHNMAAWLAGQRLAATFILARGRMAVPLLCACVMRSADAAWCSD